MMAPGCVPVDRVWTEEVNRITRWMTRLPSGDTIRVACVSVLDPLGCGVSDGCGADPVPLGLGFGGAAYGVGDGGWVMFRSMVLPSPSCWSKAIWWLVPKPPAVVKALSPLDPPMNRPRSVISVKGVPKAVIWGGNGGTSIGQYNERSPITAMAVFVGFLRPWR
jgi:hypothetical protein